jgi:lipopolysaccharide export system protein LptA
MGPGQIDMADRTTDRKVVTPRYPVHITWNDTLVSTKDGAFDLYTLTGGASFIDDDHKQQLHGKRLQVWLVPADAGKSSAAAPATVAAPKQATPSALDPARQRPRRLEAFEHVRCFSPEMNVQEAEHLVVKFKDAPPAKGVLPAALPPAVSAAGVKSGTTAAPLGTGTKLTGSSPDGKPTAGPQAPAKKPMDLWARSVVASVIRYGDKNELQKLLTEGAVHVHQDGSTPQDKGVDITGEILELYRDWENYPNPSRGDLLIVFGDSKNPLRVASLQLGNLTLKGPKVTIDQKENTAEVKGAGTMRMPSNSTLSGKKSAKDSVLDVYWNTGMFFNGKDAEFDGGAIAVQDNSRLQCRTLQVSLDKYVSLKEGQKGGQGAKVEQMVCDKKVNAEEITRLEGKLQKYSKSEGREMTFDNRDERVYVTGPGKVHLLQLGSVDDGAGTAPRPLPTQVAPKAPSRPKEEMKLTRVEYEGNMLTYKVGLDRRTTVFRDHVEVVSAPCPKEDIYMAIDKDKPPERGLYLRCAILTMYTSPDARVKGKNTQTLVAEDHAFVKTPEYQANAWKITFEEASDLVKFEGKDGVPVLFSKLSPKQGADPKQFRGRKILYNRKTRQFKVEDGDSIRLDD